MKLEKGDTVAITFDEEDDSDLNTACEWDVVRVTPPTSDDKNVYVELLHRRGGGRWNNEILNIQLVGDVESDGELGETIQFKSGLGGGEQSEKLKFSGLELDDTYKLIVSDIMNPPSELTIVDKAYRFNLREQDTIILKKGKGPDIPFKVFMKSEEGTKGEEIQILRHSYTEGEETTLHSDLSVILLVSGTRNNQGYYECSISSIRNHKGENIIEGEKYYIKKMNRLVASYRRLALAKVCSRDENYLPLEVVEKINSYLEREKSEETLLLPVPEKELISLGETKN
jgi:hypothetical protein